MRMTAVNVGVLFWVSNVASLLGSVIAGTIPNAADALTSMYAARRWHAMLLSLIPLSEQFLAAVPITGCAAVHFRLGTHRGRAACGWPGQRRGRPHTRLSAGPRLYLTPLPPLAAASHGPAGSARS